MIIKLIYKMVKAIIFDLDGVIINSIPLHIKAYDRIFRQFGFGYSPKDFFKLNGVPTFETIKVVLKKHHIKADPKVVTHQKEILVDHWLKNAPFFPGTKKTLESLKDHGFLLALATTVSRKIIHTILDGRGILPYFDSITGGDEVKRIKPDPEINLIASRKIHIPSNQCIGVDDAIIGIDSINRAGMKSIAVATGFSKVKLKKADLIVSHIGKITPALINKLNH